MKKIFLTLFLFIFLTGNAQVPVTLDKFNSKNGVKVKIVKDKDLSINWPIANKKSGSIVIDLKKNTPLFKSIQLLQGNTIHEIVKASDPAFWLTVGKRDLISQNGWNIFFDKVHQKPYQSHKLEINKTSIHVSSQGTRTIIRINEITAPGFQGAVEITLYKGSAMFNVAAVIATEKDSTAIIYDAGLLTREPIWKNISYADVYDHIKTVAVAPIDSAINQAVKYRTIIGSSQSGSIAVFPAPHQYFYPLDEAFNLKFTWYGANYQKSFKGYGIGIRQELDGDRRFVPWFNAPPGTAQRLNFFCQLSEGNADIVLQDVKRLTNNDSYPALPGFKTMASHFHNEFVVNSIIANRPMPDTPSFVKVFKASGVDIVHLAEFHYTAHPKGPDELRLLELKYLFDMCEKYSDSDLLLMPGEEPNEFFGGHWLQLFPKPVYWIMSRKDGLPKEAIHPLYGKIYRIGNASEMLTLLEKEKGLAWTAHARTKGSTGYPDKYKNEPFFKSERFLGAAWKAMPADLSQSKLGNGRVLDLMDDMNNWGERKKVIGEADLFTIEPENEMYAHLNVNYLQLEKIPAYRDGWQPVVDVLETGKFFTSTGEVLIPHFTVDNRGVGETVRPEHPEKTTVTFDVHWTFPLQFAEIITGDGTNVFRHKIDLQHTRGFGKQRFSQTIDLTNRKWIRLEVWDAAVNGAFTQTIWME